VDDTGRHKWKPPKTNSYKDMCMYACTTKKLEGPSVREVWQSVTGEEGSKLVQNNVTYTLWTAP